MYLFALLHPLTSALMPHSRVIPVRASKPRGGAGSWGWTSEVVNLGLDHGHRSRPRRPHNRSERGAPDAHRGSASAWAKSGVHRDVGDLTTDRGNRQGQGEGVYLGFF